MGCEVDKSVRVVSGKIVVIDVIRVLEIKFIEYEFW